MSTHYSRHWAQERYFEFHQKYARATEIFRKVYGVDPVLFNETMIRALQSNQPRWERLKAVIKILDRDKELQTVLLRHKLTDTEKRKYLTYVGFCVTEEMLNQAESGHRALDSSTQLVLDF